MPRPANGSSRHRQSSLRSLAIPGSPLFPNNYARFSKMLLRKKLLYLALACLCGQQIAAQESRNATARDVRLYSQLLAMTDTRQLDTALGDRALAASWQPLRAAAALAIGQVGREHGLPPDRTPSVAANAAYAIGLLRDSASIRALSASLSGNREVAREAAWALGEIGAPARGAITTSLNVAHDADVTVQLLL